MTLDELADHWEAEAEHNEKRANEVRSLDAYSQLRAQAQQLRWCAAQLRLVIRPPVVVKVDGQMDDETMRKLRGQLQAAVQASAGRMP